MKAINFNTEINEQSYLDFAERLAALDLQNGDTLELYIDSIGGDIDWAKKMAKDIQDLKDAGVTVQTIADGKVYSSALVPFLFGNEKLINTTKNPSMVVHKVAVSPEESVDLTNIDRVKGDLEQYTAELEEIYRACGVSEDAIAHLAAGNDLELKNFDEMKKMGFADRAIGSTPLINLHKIKDVFSNQRKNAKFSYQNKYEDSVKLSTTINNKSKNQMDEKMESFLNSIGTALNELKGGLGGLDAKLGDMDARVRAMEEARKRDMPAINAELTEEEFGKLKNVLRKTSVKNSGKVKNLVHFNSRCNEGAFVLPMNERFEVELEEDEDDYELANNTKYNRKKAVNQAPAVNPEAAELINKLTDTAAPVTRATNRGQAPKPAGYEAFKSATDRFAAANPVFEK